MQEQAWCPEGSEHRTSGLRMAPGDVAHVPRTPSPVAGASLVAKHFRSRARLRRLLVRLRRPTLQRSLRSLRQGASLTTFGFVTTVPRYLLEQVMPSHSFAALTALVVRRVKDGVVLLMRRVNGLGDQPRLACTSSRTPPEGALACAPGSDTLPHALVVRRVNGHLAYYTA